VDGFVLPYILTHIPVQVSSGLHDNTKDAKMLKKEAPKGIYSQGLVDGYFKKAREIYKQLKLNNKIKECV
jgi:hypothetical protein